MADSTANMGPDERLAEYKAALKQRDERIADLKAMIENIAQKKDKELAAINQKMQFIMDEKDKKIKVCIKFGREKLQFFRDSMLLGPTQKKTTMKSTVRATTRSTTRG